MNERDLLSGKWGMEVDGLEMKQAEAEGRSVVMNEGECSRSAGEREKACSEVSTLGNNLFNTIERPAALADTETETTI